MRLGLSGCSLSMLHLFIHVEKPEELYTTVEKCIIYAQLAYRE